MVDSVGTAHNHNTYGICTDGWADATWNKTSEPNKIRETPVHDCSMVMQSPIFQNPTSETKLETIKYSMTPSARNHIRYHHHITKV